MSMELASGSLQLPGRSAMMRICRACLSMAVLSLGLSAWAYAGSAGELQDEKHTFQGYGFMGIGKSLGNGGPTMMDVGIGSEFLILKGFGLGALPHIECQYKGFRQNFLWSETPSLAGLPAGSGAIHGFPGRGAILTRRCLAILFHKTFWTGWLG